MSLARDLALSASALECYRRCPRRFKQRYLDAIPLPESDLSDEALQRGQIFHNLVQWDALGYPVDGVLSASDDPQLQQHWADYQVQAITISPQAQVEYERRLTVNIGGQRLVARLDQVIHEPGGRLTIIDLKIGAPYPEIGEREQTHLYPLVAWHYYKGRADGPARPEDIRLIYWFAKQPSEPMIFTYSVEQLELDQDWLAGRINQIASDRLFPLTSNPLNCARCGYAAHCGVEVDRTNAAQNNWENEETLDILSMHRIWHDIY